MGWIGKKNGMLEIVDEKYENGGWIYTAKCDCGNVIQLTQFQIYLKMNCGCWTNKATRIKQKNRAIEQKKIEANDYTRFVDSLKTGETFVARLQVSNFDYEEDHIINTEDRVFEILNKYRAYMKVKTKLNGQEIYAFVNYKDLWMKKEKLIVISRGAL